MMVRVRLWLHTHNTTTSTLQVSMNFDIMEALTVPKGLQVTHVVDQKLIWIKEVPFSTNKVHVQNILQFFIAMNYFFLKKKGRKARLSDCEAIKTLLLVYSQALGQLVNFDKSTISFSPQVSHLVRILLLGVLGVSVVECYTKYLDFPSFSGRGRSGLFSDIKDRVWHRLKWWQHRFFSAGGCEVLLKAVVQAILQYSMQHFRLPKGFIRDLYRLSAHF
ncbi:hypothetical protein ACOSP7_032161 [Xanthoceras sorbifolium]